jgi:predicted O-methyltransferase YrrM
MSEIGVLVTSCNRTTQTAEAMRRNWRLFERYEPVVVIADNTQEGRRWAETFNDPRCGGMHGHIDPSHWCTDLAPLHDLPFPHEVLRCEWRPKQSGDPLLIQRGIMRLAELGCRHVLKVTGPQELVGDPLTELSALDSYDLLTHDRKPGDELGTRVFGCRADSATFQAAINDELFVSPTAPGYCEQRLLTVVRKHGVKWAALDWNRFCAGGRDTAVEMPDDWSTAAGENEALLHLMSYVQWSDIRDHLPLFYSLVVTRKPRIVVELGTRGGVSTVAFLLALSRVGAGHLYSCDVDACGSARTKAESLGLAPFWTFRQGDDLDWPDCPTPIDVLFVDTSHTYEQTIAELRAFAPRLAPDGVILLHDTESFPAVRRAIQEFAPANGWQADYLKASNGLGILTRRES